MSQDNLDQADLDVIAWNLKWKTGYLEKKINALERKQLNEEIESRSRQIDRYMFALDGLFRVIDRLEGDAA